ncbi:MAG TPA: 5-(carboxyamino)imidazole ribonucleotide mutase [Candidatus Omnitrophica bacterium]|nr:5-(carboxyamino)imidazole ribonucleotide mutase [Candidatus Omnitrophota bacterium]
MKKVVTIIMGSKSDLDTMKETSIALAEFGIGHDMRVMSAHRTPKEVIKFSLAARDKGIKVIIAGAGGAAHLAGVIAAHTTLPVIGVPIETRSLKGLDSLLSTVQMPKNVPVGTVAIGKSGARNAGILAAQILGVEDKKIAKKLAVFKKKLEKLAKNIRL